MRVAGAHSGAEFRIGKIPIGEIVERHGTPLFIYDRSVMEDKLRLLRDALPLGFEVYYSIKANPNQEILKFFISSGCGLEIASGGEFHQALAAGCEPARILFAGPGKTVQELEYVLAHGIGEVHVESLQEIDQLARIARDLGRPAHAAIRVNPAEGVAGGAMQMGGRPSPFGVDEELLDEAVARMIREEFLVFRGIHLFMGTQILDHKVLIRQYRRGLEIAKRASNLAGDRLHTMDFGGGLGIPYFDNETELDIAGFGQELQVLMKEQQAEPAFRDTNFVIEPGRYLVGESGVYVVRVSVVKQSRDKTYVVVDGGMNHHLAASGNLGQVIRRNFPSAVLNRLDEPAVDVVDVVGPLCTPLDVLARGIRVPAIEVGDLFGIFQSGAYARTSSPLGFLSHPSPAEAWVEGDRVRLIRRRSSYENLLEDQGPARG